MKALSLFYATNRRHEGKDRFRPEGYGAKFSDDGSENLRFGKLTLQADERKINEFLNKHAQSLARSGVLNSRNHTFRKRADALLTPWGSRNNSVPVSKRLFI